MNLKITSLYLISIFTNILKDEVFSSFTDFLKKEESESDLDVILKSYADFTNKLYNKAENRNLFEYVKDLIYTDENIISKGCSDCIKDNTDLLNTAQYELYLISEVIKKDYETVKNELISKFPQMKELLEHLPKYKSEQIDFDIHDILEAYQKKGYGVFSCYSAFKYNKNEEIKPVKYIDNITFNDLKNYEYQQNVIKQNTLAFLENKSANNVLLYGDRGCGKSSTVKALLNEFADYNLKMIQVTKDSFIKLPELFEKIRTLPLKFIIFADDLSFDEDDEAFSLVKAILEGSLSNKPQNILIYATSNRMHMVKETFTNRQGSEVHYNDTLDELVSLSDRFGIMLTFSSLTKNEYLDIVRQIANDCCVEYNEELQKKAMAFSVQKAIMTPRVARQFINDYISNTNY